MTIKCPTCGAVIAERCPWCLRKAKVMGRLSDCLEYDQIRARYQCPGMAKKTAVVCWCGKCRRYFEQGVDGSKPGTCEKCRPVQQEFLTQMNADELKR